jgi:hypothetical protein
MITVIFANLTPADFVRLKRADIWHTARRESEPGSPLDPLATTVDQCFVRAIVALDWRFVVITRSAHAASTWIVRHGKSSVARRRPKANQVKTRKS